jgi:SAM-dependent methyltransferase
MNVHALRQTHVGAAVPRCLGCGAALVHTFVDLGSTPLANSYIEPGTPEPDPSYPLHARVCERCLLVQVEPAVPPDAIFSDYAYFSSFSDSWLAHCRAYAGMAIERFALSAQSMVVEVASNDGYLLTNFVAAGIPCLGIEPAANVAECARKKGVPTEIAFFGAATARRLATAGRKTDLLIANNVLAHVPDINDFVSGIGMLLKDEGVCTIEFPHLLNLIRELQFDTIYHEHFTYLSLLAVERIFARHALRVFDVEELPTHGGSLRIYGCRSESAREVSERVARLRAKESDALLDRPEGYAGFGERIDRIRRELIWLLDAAQGAGHKVAAYGAAAKGNTLLNYCGIGREQLAFVAERNPAKQGRLLPGSRVPIVAPEAIFAEKPDYLLVLPWNLKDEIVEQNAAIRDWGGKFITAIPEIRID